MKQDLTQTVSGNTQKFQSTATATLFNYQIDFTKVTLSEDVISDLASITDDQGSYTFIRKYGSHVLSYSQMGSKFVKETYISTQADMSEVSQYLADSSSNSFASSSEYSFSQSVDASVGVGSVSVSASESTDTSSSSSSESSSDASSETSSSTSSESSETNGYEQITLYGMVAAESTACGDITGTENILLPIDYETVGLWQAYPDVEGTSKIEDFYYNYLMAAIDCSTNHCSGNGVCKSNSSAFEEAIFSSYDDLFDQSSCICQNSNQYSNCAENSDYSVAIQFTNETFEYVFGTGKDLCLGNY